MEWYGDEKEKRVKASELKAFMAEYRATFGPITDGEMAKLLGIHRDTMTDRKQNDAVKLGKVWRLALSALMHNLEGYGEKK